MGVVVDIFVAVGEDGVVVVVGVGDDDDFAFGVFLVLDV